MDNWRLEQEKTDTVCRTAVTTDKSPAIDLLQRQSSGGGLNLARGETEEILNVGQERRRAKGANRRVITDEKERPFISRKNGRYESYGGPMTEGGESFVSVQWTMRKGASMYRKQGSGRNFLEKWEKGLPNGLRWKKSEGKKNKTNKKKWWEKLNS